MMRARIRSRSLARALGLCDLPTGLQRRLYSLTPASSRPESHSKPPPLVRPRRLASPNLARESDFFSDADLEHGISESVPPLDLSRFAPPLRQPPPSSFSHGAKPPAPLKGPPPAPRFPYYSTGQYDQRKQFWAIRAAKELREKIARGEAVNSPRKKQQQQRNHDKKLAAFIRDSHDALNSNNSVAEAMSHLGLLAPDDRLPGLAITLMPHQVIGTSWMAKQEAKEDQRGGILADDMGLGKTIQMLALMAVNRSKDPAKRKTLIVVPTPLMMQWKKEIESKAPGLFKVFIYHGTNRGTKYAAEGEDADVVISTYGIIRSELGQSDSPLFATHWYRTILDEAHEIRKSDTNSAIAVARIKSDYRWTLTGTPIFNSMQDLYPHFRFLRIPTFEHENEFKRLISDRSVDRDTAGARLHTVMRAIMFRRTKNSRLDGKRIVDLLPKTETIERLEFSPSEHAIYEALRLDGAASFLQMGLPESLELKHNPAMDVIVRLLRLRQTACHPSLVTNSTTEDVDEKDAYQTQLLEDQASLAAATHGDSWVEETRRQLGSRDLVKDPPTCVVCSKPASEPLITSCCRDYLCSGCLDDLPLEDAESDESAEQRAVCPSCDGPLGADDFFTAAAFTDHTVPKPEHKISSAITEHVQPSTKMARMLQLVKEWLEEDPTAKIIVFSQWTSHLQLIEKFLSQEGFATIVFTGGLAPAKRVAALETFETEPEPKILLMNVKAGGVGLNIVRANKIIFMDLSWSPFTEAQAIGRAHRIGQTKPVDVRRLVVRDTVEDIMQAIQRRKRYESDISLGEGHQQRDAPPTRAELRELFGLLPSGDGTNSPPVHQY